MGSVNNAALISKLQTKVKEQDRFASSLQAHVAVAEDALRAVYATLAPCLVLRRGC